MSNSAAVFRPKYLTSAGTEIVPVLEGSTVLQIIENLGLKESEYDYLIVQIKGTNIPRHMWARVRPTNGAHVAISRIPQGGGDDDKGPFRIIAMIILVIVAVYTGQWYLANVAGATSTGAALVQAGVMIAGSMIINKVFPPPALNFDNASRQISQGGPAPTIQGQRNSARPFAPVNRILGYIRHFPDYAAEPFVQQVGSESQYLYLLFDFGYGPLKLYNHKIGDNDVNKYSEVEMVVHENLTSATDLELYTRDIQTSRYAFNLNYNTPVYVTTAPDVNACQLDFTFSGGLYRIKKSDGARQGYSVSFTLRYRKVGDSVWRAFGNLAYSFSNGTTVADYAWGFPQDVEVDDQGRVVPVNQNVVNIIITGGQIIPTAPGYGKSEVTNPIEPPRGYLVGATQVTAHIGADIPAGAVFNVQGVTYTISNPVSYGTDGLNKTIQFTPPLKYNYITEGSRRPDDPQGGDGVGGPVHTTPQQVFAISQRTTNFYTHNMYLRFADAGQYEFEITRRTVDDEDYETDESASVSAVTLTALRNIKNSFPVDFKKGHCLVEMKIKATDQLSGVIDSYSAEASSVVRVADEFGTLYEDETQNPAWLALEVLTGNANPKPLPDSSIDMDSFIAFADHCDKLDPTETEPMYRMGIAVNYETTVLNLFRSILAVGRATETIINGKFGIIFDEVKTVPVQVITGMNSSRFKASRSFGDIPHAVRVTFLDPDANWAQNQVTVYNDGYDENNATEIFDYPSFGCYRHSQAWRDGRLAMADAIARQEMIEISMDVENLVCVKGDYVQFEYDAMKVGGKPARIVDIEGDTFYLSENFDIGGTPNPTIRVRGQNNSVQDFDIVEQISGSVLRTSGVIPSAVRIGDLALIGNMETIAGDYIIKEILPGPDLTATLKLTNLANEIHDAIDGPLPSWDPIISDDGVWPPGHVENLVITQTLTYLERLPYLTVTVDWDKPDIGLVEFYEVYLYRNDQWNLLDIVYESSHNIYELVQMTDLSGIQLVGEEIIVKVLAVSPTGLKRSLLDAPEATLTISGDTEAPPAVFGFTSEATRDSLQLRWTALQVEDLAGYLLRFNSDISGSATWSNSAQLVQSVAWNNNTVKVSLRPGTYMIRPYDTSGNLGPVSYHTTTVPSVIGLNIVDTHHDEPIFWPGVKTNLTVVDNKLRLIDPTVDGFYYFSTKSSFPTSFVCRLFADLKMSMLQGSEQQVFVEAQVRMGLAGWTLADWVPMSIADPLSLNEIIYSGWQNFQAGDYTANVFEFRIIMRSLDNGVSLPEVEDCKIEVDMPDRTARGTIDKAELNQTYRVEFQPYFFAAPNIAIAYSSQGSDIEYEVDNVDGTGFDLTFTQAGGPPADDVDWIAVGYGYRFEQPLIPE